MILQKTYNRGQFIDFVTKFLPGINIDEREIKITDTRSSNIESAHLLGESKELDLKVFEIKHTGTSKRRVGLTMEGFQIMRSSGAFRALIAFYSQADEQWRFSLMTLTPKRNEKAKLIIERSSPKRYSFVLGPNSKTATPEKFLISKGTVSDFEDLQSRFSLEVVNKDFYKKISELFTKLVGGTIGNGKGKIEYEPLLKLPSIQDKSQTSLEFAVRLIGRVIFCWFLREKKSKDEVSLMPLTLLSHEAVKANENYYHSVLEPIFFEVLNKPIKERKEKFTQNGFNSIPYLNGGLFTPHYDDFFYYNEGKQAIFNNTVKVPDVWLQDFFEFLETYNFTIDENISFDEELSIDPEMLGRIFENLLAEINPETGESARKSTGSYYTPRTIVDYMVDESLYAYLDNKTGIDEEKIRAVISYNLGDDAKYPLTEEEQKNITEALHQIKILDPACGSGAFPMGMLQKIVFILQQTDPDGKNWFKKQIQHASPEIRRAIEREFKNKNFDYIRKLGIIRENIFGVDIQPIATEISRLRCFLTLIVDESIDDNAENRGIEPLPNLDFKFVTANALIGLPQSTQSPQQANLFEDDAGIAELQELRDMFFNSTGAERDKLKFEFVQVQKRMLDHLIQSSIRGHAELTSKLTTWDPFSHQASSWFDPEWMFGIKDGFDVVIANPPYVDSESMTKTNPEFRDVLKDLFSTTKGNWDLYIPFLEIGYKLLKPHGVASYITPNKWYAIGYGKEIRKLLSKSIKRILNCDSIKVFEAGNSPVVTIFSKNQFANVIADKMSPDYSISETVNIKTERLANNFGIALANHLHLITKIEQQKCIVNDFYDVENPCTVSEAYEIKKLLQDLGSELHQNKFFKFINTGTIDPFISLWGIKTTTYLKGKYQKPVINKDIFKQKYPRRYKQFNKEKIIISGMRHFEAFLDTKNEYIPGKSTEILVMKNPEVDLVSILGILNSKIITFYIKNIYSTLGIDGGINFTPDLIKNLPIPNLSQIDTQRLRKETQKMIENPNSDLKELDIIVYNLYQITEKEIEIIENSFKK